MLVFCSLLKLSALREVLLPCPLPRIECELVSSVLVSWSLIRKKQLRQPFMLFTCYATIEASSVPSFLPGVISLATTGLMRRIGVRDSKR